MLYDPEVVEQLAKEIAKESSFKEDKRIYIEKDIWLTYFLRYLYKIENAPNELIFKGGTSLVKCYYGYYRFSEDLDFTWAGKRESKKNNRKKFKEKYIDKLISDFDLDLEETAEIKEGARHSQSGKILNYFFILPSSEERIQKPKVKINISFDEEIDFPIKHELIKPMQVAKKNDLIGYFGKAAEDYFDPMAVSAYSKEEIACEKLRAIMTRKEKINRSRDILDLFYLAKDVDLAKVGFCKECQGKIRKSLKVPSYGQVAKERMANIDQYLTNIIEYTKNEPVYVTEIDYSQLSKFAMEKLKLILLKILE
jgi:predicted nucleotidyltransferase component of viral defense system